MPSPSRAKGAYCQRVPTRTGSRHRPHPGEPEAGRDAERLCPPRIHTEARQTFSATFTERSTAWSGPFRTAAGKTAAKVAVAVVIPEVARATLTADWMRRPRPGSDVRAGASSNGQRCGQRRTRAQAATGSAASSSGHRRERGGQQQAAVQARRPAAWLRYERGGQQRPAAVRAWRATADSGASAAGSGWQRCEQRCERSGQRRTRAQAATGSAAGSSGHQVRAWPAGAGKRSERGGQQRAAVRAQRAAVGCGAGAAGLWSESAGVRGRGW